MRLSDRLPHAGNRSSPIKLQEGSADNAAKKYSRIVWVLRWLSKVKSKLRNRLARPARSLELVRVRTRYWLAEAPVALKVSGGSKKH